MQTFLIYPKKRELFTLDFHKFESSENGDFFILYDHVRRELGVLARNQIAAIIPSKRAGVALERPDARTYTFYLKGHLEPFTIDATHNQADDSIPHRLVIDGHPLTDTYIDPERVIGVTHRLRHE